MSRSKNAPKTPRPDPQQLARAAIDTYMAELLYELPDPDSHAPASPTINLQDAARKIQAALILRDGSGAWPPDEEAQRLAEIYYSRNAGFLLGVELGRRLGGGR